MVSAFATALLLALTRAEIIERLKSPVITQCEGLVQVYANCPEDMRREYQMPVASFAAETVKTLYRGLRVKPTRYRRPGIVIHLGDVRTNDTAVVARVSTNDARVVSRIFVPSPGYADLSRLRLEIVKGFLRVVQGATPDDATALATYRRSDPVSRIADERQSLEDWLAGRGVDGDDEHYLALMRKVIEPGKASRRDVLIFASRLFLYPQTFDRPFCGRFDCLSFKEAVRCARHDAWVRVAAFRKANEMLVFGGGRGPDMDAAARAYWTFLLGLARLEKSEEELLKLLDDADVRLNVVLEKAAKGEDRARPRPPRRSALPDESLPSRVTENDL